MRRFLMVLVTIIIVIIVARVAIAIPLDTGSEDSLQEIFDNFTIAPIPGDSSVDVTTDYINDSLDSYWSITASGGSIATIIIELAGYAGINNFGIYDGEDHVQVFGGSSAAGTQALISILTDGSVYVNFVDTEIDFASGNRFGFYLDSTAGTNGGMWYSDSILNSDGEDHMLAYQGNDIDTIQLPSLDPDDPQSPGLWESNSWILAFEDLTRTDGTSDDDFQDFVVMVESVSPVPEPGTLFLILGLCICAVGIGSKKFKE